MANIVGPLPMRTSVTRATKASLGPSTSGSPVPTTGQLWPRITQR